MVGSPPSPRGGHTAVVHGDTMYAFGGPPASVDSAGSQWLSEDRARPLRPRPARPAPPALAAPAAAGALLRLAAARCALASEAASRLASAVPPPRAGKSGRSPFNDLCEFSFEKSTWKAVKVGAAHTPAPRCAHVCVVHARSLFVFGGCVLA